MAPETKVRLPSSSTKRSQMTYMKLLRRFEPLTRVFVWKGRIFRPGATILETDLWPDGSFPRIPLLVEFAGAENPAKGWNRHKSDETAILWRYERSDGKDGEFVEVGRVVAPNGIWALLLEPLVREAMAQQSGTAVPDFGTVRDRIAKFLAAELDLVGDADRARLLAIVHDELASRIAQWGEPGSVELVPLRVV